MPAWDVHKHSVVACVRARNDVQASCELQAGVHALWVSAKGAVDSDLVQSALEEGELLIIELGDEQL